MSGSIRRVLVRVVAVAALATSCVRSGYAEDWVPLWSAASLSVPRSELAATSLGNKVYFGGGRDSISGYSDVVDIYDTSAGSWSTATLSVGHRALAATSLGSKVFFAGGTSTTSYCDVVDIYDTSTGSWSTASLSEPRAGLAAASAAGKVVFGGGIHGSVNGTVDIYDTSAGTWSATSLSVSRGQLAAASVASMVFFGGGFPVGDYSNVVDIYNASAGTWSATILSQARRQLAATSVGSRVYFGGGETTGSAYSNVVDIFDTSTASWSTASLSQARQGLAAASVGNKVLFAGGTNSSKSSVVDIYDTSSGSWSTTNLGEARDKLAATSVGNQAFFAGGATSSGQSNRVDIYRLQHYSTITSSQVFTLGDNTTVDGLTDLSSSASLSLGNYSLVVGSMQGVGAVHLGTSMLTVGGDNSPSTTYSGAIDGNGSIVKTGTGALVIAGPCTYIGGTTIANGTLRMGVSDRLANSGPVTVNGGTFDLGGYNETVGAVTLAAGWISGSGTLTGSSYTVQNGTVAANLAGSGTLQKTTTGTVVVTGNLTYSGTTTITSGALQIGSGGSTGGITGNVTNNSALVFNRATDSTYAGTISGVGNLSKYGPGVLTLSSTSSYSGPTNLNGGLMQVSALNKLGNGTILNFNGGGLQWAPSGAFDPSVRSMNFLGPATLDTNGNDVTLASSVGNSGSGSLTKAGNGRLTLTASNTYTGGTTIARGTLQIGNLGGTGSISGNIVNNASLIFSRTDAVTYSSIISGSGSLTQFGNTLILAAANDFTGPTYINAGTIQLSHYMALQNSTVHLDNGVLDIATGSAVLGGLAGLVNLDIAYGITVGGNNESTTYSGIVGGNSGRLTKTGNGTLTLQGANTYNGGTIVNGGTLRGNTTSLRGTITNNAAVVFDQPFDATYAGTLSGTGTTSKSGGGSLTLTGNVSTATVVNAGRLVAATGAMISGNATVESAGRFESAGGQVHLNNLTNRGTFLGNAQISGTLSNQSGGSLRISSGQSVLVDGTGSHSNAGLIEALGTPGALGGQAEFECVGPLTNASGTGLITGRNATLRFSGGLNNQGSLGLSTGYTDVFGEIINTGNISVAGAAAVTFYDDVTQNGVLVVSAAGGTHASAVFFGALSGSGSVTGGGDIFLMGDLRPGNSPAEVTFDANVTLAPTVTTVMELAGLTPGSQYDKIDVTGSLVLAGNLAIVPLDGFEPQPGDQFQLFEGNISGTFSSISLPALSGNRTWDTSNLYTLGSVSVVPEPGTLVMLFTAAVGVLGWARRTHHAPS